MKTFIAAAAALIAADKDYDCSEERYAACEAAVKAAFEELDDELKQLADFVTYAVVREVID